MFNYQKHEIVSLTKSNDDFNMKKAIGEIKTFIDTLMILSFDELQFIEAFENGNYVPALLFNNPNIIASIINHPMALWKIANIRTKQLT